MFYQSSLSDNSLATVANKKVFRNSREDDPEAFVMYVKGWAEVVGGSEEAKIFFFREHLAGEAKIWAESVVWSTGFDTLCEAFMRRFKGKMAQLGIIKQLANERYKEGSFLAFLDNVKRLAMKAALPEVVLITFALNGLPDDIGGNLLMNACAEMTWQYIYNACEGLDCSDRVNKKLYSRGERLEDTSQMELCRIGKATECWACGKKGHIKRDCRNAKRYNKKPIRSIKEDRESSEHEHNNKNNFVYYILNELKTGLTAEMKVPISIKHNKTRALIDTGSMVNVIRKKFVIQNDIRRTKIRLTTAKGSSIRVLGETEITFELAGTKFQATFIVSDEITSDVIIGMKFLREERAKIDCGENIQIKWTKRNTQNLGEHKILTTCDMPISSAIYRLGPHKEEHAKSIIEKYLQDGIIRESVSPWRSPIVLADKNNGEYRLCVDYRRLNEVTVKDSYPMPRIDDILDSLYGAKIFTKLDALSGFHQIPMCEEDIEKTAFGCREGLFEFVKMPFGLVNAPATFQRAMNRILKNFIGKYVMVYMDDIVIYSHDRDIHEKHVKEVTEQLKRAGVILNEKKCEYSKNEIKLLGHVISGSGVRVDPGRIESITNLEVPKTKQQLESFLGTVNYCSKFLKGITKTTNYLYELTRKDKKLDWKELAGSDIYIAAINEVKKMIARVDELALPDLKGNFILTTDASDVGIGAILTQIQEGKERIISYYAKALTKAEKNYSTSEKELLGVIRSVDHFRHYLLGKKFILRTDHSAIQWLFKSTNMKTKFARWALYLQEYDMEVVHIKGINNPSDSLSRLVQPELEINSITTDKDKEKIILRESHKRLAHGGVEAMIYDLRRSRIVGLRRKVTEVIKHCIACQQMGRGHVKKSIRPLKVNKRNEVWEIDLVGPLPISAEGYKYIMTVVDHYSKIGFVKALRGKTGEEVYDAVVKCILQNGKPEMIITDRGAEFQNTLMKALADKNGIEWRYGAPYSPTTTGLVERFNRTFMDKLRKTSKFGRIDWPSCLQSTLEGYQLSWHRAINCTPSEMAERKGIKKEYKEKYLKSYASTRGLKRKCELAVGDSILYHDPVERKHKLSPDYTSSGVVVAKRFGSVDIQLANGRLLAASLNNVRKFFKQGESVV